MVPRNTTITKWKLKWRVTLETSKSEKSKRPAATSESRGQTCIQSAHSLIGGWQRDDFFITFCNINSYASGLWFSVPTATLHKHAHKYTSSHSCAHQIQTAFLHPGYILINQTKQLINHLNSPKQLQVTFYLNIE